MNIKFILKQTILIFLISFLAHNMYEWLPSFISSIFFPVNESIWEHLKMIFTTYILVMLFFKKDVSSYLITGIFNIIFFLIIYLPIYITFGENIVVTLILYFISIFISAILSNHLLKRKKHLKSLNTFSIISIILIFIIFGILTYYPIKNKLLFYDHSKNHYGISN